MNAGASPAAKAYRDAARRLAGEPVPLAMPSEKKPFFSRLFGRRAA
jgi:septum site-determining protein MinD